MSSKPSHKVLVICGPTATGKTALGVRLAKTFNGEIISADSRQVYKRMNALTGKRDADPGVRVWLQDIVDPEEDFSIAKWREMFWDAANQIWDNGKLPIAVGLTGFYLHALTNQMETIDIPPNQQLRKELEEKTAKELGELLKIKDSEKFDSMNTSDQQNPRRLIRAIEVAGQPRPRGTTQQASYLFIGLNAPTEILDKKIDQSIDERTKEALEETKGLLAKNIVTSKQALQTHGFRNLAPHIRGEITIEDAVARWKTGEHQDARKQYSRLKKETDINWFDIAHKNFPKNVEELVASWYTRG